MVITLGKVFFLYVALKGYFCQSGMLPGNQLRLWFSSIAYVLINALREQCLAKTEFKNATVRTIRTKLLKLRAIITIIIRRVLIAISSICPYKEIFATVYQCLSQLPCPG